jgi:putative transposase
VRLRRPRAHPACGGGRHSFSTATDTALLRQAAWTINDKRVEPIWQREGLKVPHKQPKRGRLWLADGSCIRLRPQQRYHVWSYDFVEDRTSAPGKKASMFQGVTYLLRGG